MRILGIDARGLESSSGAGIAHAARELIDAMRMYAGDYGIELKLYRERMSGLELRLALRRDGVNHVFVPAGSVSPFLRGVLYPWVHDVAIFWHPEWFPQSWVKRLFTTRMFLFGIKRARHVFAVSHETARAIREFVFLAEQDVTVTYQGANVGPLQWDRVDPPYVLALGSVEPRKNLVFIDTLWPRVLARVPHARLIVAGREGWGDVQLKHAERILTFDDARRDQLLIGASALILPSLYEGFGRTVLEAMSLGVPVIASDRGAIPEVVGKAGILLSPADINGWVTAMTLALKGELDGSIGIERSQLFSWESTARLILAKIQKTW